MWVIIYHCPECDCNYGRTEEFSHDHCFDEPEVRIEEQYCPGCLSKQEKK